MAQNLKNIKANATLSSIPSMTVTGNSTLSNIALTGNIIPNVGNTYSLGNLTNNFKDIYVGPGSLYVNGKKVLEDVSGTVQFTTDINQNLKITTSGSGDIQFDPTGTGVVLIKGPLQIEAGSNITSSDGGTIHFSNPIGIDSLTTHSANTDLAIFANGTGTIKLNDDVTVSGNLTVNGTTTYINTETVQLYDNIIDLNSNFTTGSPSENAGIRIMRGDEAGVLIRWNESTDKWQYTNDGSTYVDFVGTTSTGNTSLSNIAIANYFSGNGSSLTSITGANVTGAVTYATTANSVAGANVSGNVTSAVQAHYANIANSVAVSNVSGIGNIATINIDGNVSNILYGNGVFAAAPTSGAGSYGNSNVATFLASFGSNTISTTGNVSVGNIIGNGQALTNITGGNVTGAVSYATTANSVAGANVSGNVTSAVQSHYANIANSVAGANVSGQVTYAATANSVAGANVSGTVSSATSATTAGTVTTAAQPNITSTGTLTSLTSGTHTFNANANIAMSGTLSQISGANLISGTYLTGTLTTAAQPNITSVGTLTSLTSGTHTISANANIAMSGTLSQISGANLISGTYLTGTLTTAAQPNITSTGTLTSVTTAANGNITMSGSLSQLSGANLLSASYFSGDGSSLTNLKPNLSMTVALSDETTAITTGVGKVTFRAPYAMTLYQIPRASVSTASTSGNPAVNIKKNGTTIFSTTLTIDANEKTSVTAATAAVLSTTTFADDDEITMDIDTAGTGTKGLKVTLYYRRT